MEALATLQMLLVS